MSEMPSKYFKHYRETIGFTSQNGAKKFLGGKDICPGIDYNYLKELIARIESIVRRINSVVAETCIRDDLESFIHLHIYTPAEIIKDAGLLPRLNNQGRRPEEVLFSWLRGYVTLEYFAPTFSRVFDVDFISLTRIGDDDLKNIDTFRRTPKADLEIDKGGKCVRLEIQSGFQGINDIKEHKVREAKRVFEEEATHSVCIHLDLFNGQVAFVQLDSIADNDCNFVTRQQMEGQSVFSIDQNYFKWRLLDEPPILDELDLEL